MHVPFYLQSVCTAAGFAVLFVGARISISVREFAVLRLVVFGALTASAWYLAVPGSARTEGMVLYGGCAAFAAWHLYAKRPRPGWWGGAHERIEQT